ncbi:hypothetical protein R3W88_027890 [Solanum pinnatisectum]|uniref:Cystatin domain-containing protein n=1 Tax=Solanum pinnatisectum TaxID=50273 RepID=A0AAV9LHB5_9SOLN|nr:hypothetical protein R3W88_027890 [Solanum pinnatisectum]
MQDVDPKDPKVIEIAKFALNEFNKKETHNYQLREVDEVTTFPNVDGVSFHLHITTNEFDTISYHLAIVVVRSNNVKKLVAFDGSGFIET